jgi:RNA polymerase sigma-70 factor, ECF subfamily
MSLPSANDQDTAPPLAHSIASAQGGSYAALGQLFDFYRDYLMRVANDELQTNLVAKVAASDLVQDTFLQAGRDFRKFTGTSDGELKAWLRQILLHNLQDAQRRFHLTQKRAIALEVRLPTNESTAAPHVQLASPMPSPSQCMVTAEMREAVQAAIRKLPPDYARVIELRTFAGLSFDRIGETLGRSAEAVRKLWGRAIEQLANELGPYDSDER